MKRNWALDRKSRARFVKTFDISEAQGNRLGEVVVYTGSILPELVPVKDQAAIDEKERILLARMNKQVEDAKAKKSIYQSKAKRSKTFAIILLVLSVLGFATFFSAQYIEVIASYLLPIIEEITYGSLSLAAITVFSLSKAIRDRLILNEIEKDILVSDQSAKLNEAKRDELNLIGLSFRGKSAIRKLNEDNDPIDVFSADQLGERDLLLLLENAEKDQEALVTGHYSRETLGGKKYELKPKQSKKLNNGFFN